MESQGEALVIEMSHSYVLTFLETNNSEQIETIPGEMISFQFKLSIVQIRHIFDKTLLHPAIIWYSSRNNITQKIKTIYRPTLTIITRFRRI